MRLAALQTKTIACLVNFSTCYHLAFADSFTSSFHSFRPFPECHHMTHLAPIAVYVLSMPSLFHTHTHSLTLSPLAQTAPRPHCPTAFLPRLALPTKFPT
ncbi:hypothetical protein EDB92DRAFT_2341 [Lactarius akahatsu]|uniref:Uncharacterized protein n=1 Tax=Lactarius akahatsu TaxID=416441 RepID=A0AAD4LSH8_9AGAM|nr:hypothetical protein EDB92DRAFT_2341 [Lactarius akahatsu]